MSNAMRSGKRWFAGVAAGALGAGLLVAGATAPASATTGVAASFTLSYPSYTVVSDNWTSASPFKAGITFEDSDGEAVQGSSLGANRALRVSFTNPIVVPSSTTVLATNLSSNQTTSATAANSMTFAPSSTAGFTTWQAIGANGAGTYNMNVALVNTASGAIIQAAIVPIQVVQAAAAPAPSVNYINASNNVINSLGVEADDTAANQSIYLTNATGGPYSAKFTRVVDSATDDTSLGLNAVTGSGSALTYQLTPTPTDDTTQAANPGVYTFAKGGTSGKWNATAGRNFINTTVWIDDEQAANGSLPVAVGSLTAGATAELTTTPSYQPGTTPVWQVPPGTTSLAFAIEYSSATAGTLPWNMTSSTPAGVVTLSGGTAAISSAGLGTINVNVNAAAAANGKNVQLVINGVTVATVNFTKASPLIDTITPLAKVSSATEIPGTITDQYGDALSGTWTLTLQPSGGTCFTTSTQISSATANAAGEFTLAVPATAAATTAQTLPFLVCATNGTTAVTNGSASVTYTATGGVTAVDLVSSVPNIPVIATPATGVVTTTTDTNNSVTSAASANVNLPGSNGSSVFRVSVQTTPVVAVTLSVPEGAYLTTSTNTTLAWNTGKRSVVVAGNGTTSVIVYATKPGTYDVTATVGTSTDKETFVAGVQATAARQIKVAQEKLTMPRLDVVQTTADVTDIYGNPVPLAPVSITGSGAVFSPTTATTANAAGKVVNFISSGEAQGKGLVSYTLTSPVTSAISGSPALVQTATTEVTVGADSGKSILIVGERTTVSGKPGIRVEGDTKGFDVGTKMVPNVRFPGESEYSPGTARPTTSVAGDFTWQRKTGKKIYVFFTNEAGDVKSNRVIIAAN